MQLEGNELAGPIPPPWSKGMRSVAVLDLASNTGICGGQPAWRAGTEVGMGRGGACWQGQVCWQCGSNRGRQHVVLERRRV